MTDHVYSTSQSGQNFRPPKGREECTDAEGSLSVSTRDSGMNFVVRLLPSFPSFP